MRYAIAFVAAVTAVTFACQTAPPGTRPVGPGSAAGSGVTTAKSKPPPGKPPVPGSAAPAAPSVVLKDIGCLTPTCVYHAGVNRYLACQSGGSGTCFHFGAACTPDGACMYDASSRGYKQCTKVAEGTCSAWGAACAPASKCMFNPADNLHHKCEDVGGGTCKRYGALCAP